MQIRKSEWKADVDYLRRHCREQGIDLTDDDYKKNEQLKIQKMKWIEENGNWNAAFVLTFNGTLGNDALREDKKADEEAHKKVRKFWNIIDRQRYGKKGVKNGKRYKRIGTKEKGKTGTNRHWNYIIDTDGESVKLFIARATDVWETMLGMGKLHVIEDVSLRWGVYSAKEISIFNSDALDEVTTHL